MSVPGIGPITASAIAASVQEVGAFSGPREFAAFLGLAPRQNSSGGKDASDACQKWETDISESCWSSAPMLSSSTESPIRMGRRCGATKLMETKPFKLVAVAMANKLARIAFAVMRDGSIYGSAMAG